MNKNTKSISRTKKPQAKVAKGKTTKTQAKVAKGNTTKTQAKVAKGKTTKTQATKPQAKGAKSKTTKTQTTKKVSTTKNKEPSDLPIKQVAKRRASTAAAVNDKQQVTKRTCWVKTEEPPDFLSDDFLSEDPSIKQVAKRTSTAAATKVKESSDKILDDEAARLKREEYLEKLRQYYQANREIIRKKQNSKYPDRKERVKNNPELIAKQRQASKKYYHQNKDKILPKIKRRYVEKVAKEKGLEICPCCGKIKGPAAKRGE